MQKIVDSHVHFINPDLLPYPWMKDAPELQKLFEVTEYQAATSSLPVKIEKINFIEVCAEWDQNFKEVKWVESLQQKDPRIAGITARAPLTDEKNIMKILEDLKSHLLVKSIRDIIQWEGPGYCCQDSYQDGVCIASDMGFRIELCIYHHQLGDVLKLVKSCPDAEFILNHCGKPGIREGLLEPWKSQIKKLSEFENICCKISALLTEADVDRWKKEEFKPYTDHVIECFGVDRILYGGDWPVVTLAGSYADWFKVTQFFTKDWSEAEKDAYYYENAMRVYAL